MTIRIPFKPGVAFFAELWRGPVLVIGFTVPPCEGCEFEDDGDTGGAEPVSLPIH